MRRLRNSGRKKAFWGMLAASVAGSAISTLGSLFGSKKQADASEEAARSQAAATEKAAKIQADAIRQQTLNETSLQKQSIAETKQMHEEDKRLQEAANMTLQMMNARNNYEERLKSTELNFKEGGRIGLGKKVGNIGRIGKFGNVGLTGRYSLRGSQNVPFKVTDGGGVIYEGSTPEGYDLYEIYGNDHEHSHKVGNGKRKTGVGFKFGGNSVVEGEGNQNSNIGEKLLVTPNDALFISKHSINGFNPAEAVDKGMHPLVAFNGQEINKKMKNNKRFTMGGLYPNDITYFPINQKITSNTIPVAAVANRMKKGGRIKADFGAYAPFIGAGISTIGNLIGAGITSRANNRAAGILSDAYSRASESMINAYNQMHGIDLNEIKKEDYEAAQAMANTRAAIVNVNPQLEQINRTARRQLKAINNSTLSSAARLNRIAAIEDNANTNRNQVYADKETREAAIGRENLQEINATERLNAQLRSQANKDYTNSRLALLQYNNDIENNKISGIGQAQADAITGSANAFANARTQNGAVWNQAISASGSSIGKAFDTYATNKATKDGLMLGASDKFLLDQGWTRNKNGEWEPQAKKNDVGQNNTNIPSYLIPFIDVSYDPNYKYKLGGRIRRTLK